MKNNNHFGIRRIAIMGVALVALFGILTFSTSPQYGYAATVDAVSSATTIATPTLSVASTGYQSITLKWTGVSNATRYEVYRATSSTGTYAKVATVSATTLILKANTMPATPRRLVSEPTGAEATSSLTRTEAVCTSSNSTVSQAMSKFRLSPP